MKNKFKRALIRFYTLFLEIFVCKCCNKKINGLICELFTLEI
jgi:hypothetical protein